MEHLAASPPSADDGLFRDGIGERRLLRDGAGRAQELLCIRAALADVPAFEFALRERVSRLATFKHPYFVPVRAVERLDEPAFPLGLVSDRFNGIRLSRLLPRAAARGVPLDIDTVVFLLRQLVPALAAFHLSHREMAHGALSAERVLFTANGRLMVAEYALGSALEQLRYSRDRYWRELHVATSQTPSPSRLDQRTDVLQLGLVALSLVLGRNLRDEETGRIGDAVAAAWAVLPQGGFEPLPPALRGWLARALQVDPGRSFSTAVEASDALEMLVSTLEYPGTSASVDTFLARYRAVDAEPAIAAAASHDIGRFVMTAPSDRLPSSDPPLAASAAAVDDEATELSSESFEALSDFAVDGAAAASTPAVVSVDAEGLEDFGSEDFPRDSPAVEREEAPRPSGGQSHVVQGLEAQVALMSPSPVDGTAPLAYTATEVAPEFDDDAALPPKEASEEVRNRAFLRAPDRLGFDWPVTAAILIGLAALVVLSRWLIVPAPARTGTLAVTTTPAGATVLIDGQPFGTTPLSASLTSGTHTLELQGVGETRTVPVTMTPGAHLEQYIELARHAAPARVPETGWLTLRTPLALDVYNGNRLVGNTGSGRLTLPVGPHVLTVRNDRFGFRRTLSVGILAGKSTLADVEVPSGRVIVHALPWAEITVDGRIVGEASAASGFWIPIGTHEIVLRHPELGEQRHQINVLSSNVVRLAVDLRRP